ncbi:hypothetical protein EST38_g6876 [Candolleomyces aberdarensis]|uniref:AB hydrolase-1 domain-containing protein n=1 Tax=Candolleomyces aberdarensis TaxID=2316362 RepID=A0A4Q2DII9_9AGAR|nr:hypothetical protein EST38_g6876 [Candolleomyces aberdarensis]
MALASYLNPLNVLSSFLHIIDLWTIQPVLRLTSFSESPTTKPEDGHFFLELSGGAKLSYQIRGSEHYGKTRPLVLVCGMSALMLDYDRLSSALSKTHPVLLYDHRGMGLSKLTPSGDEEMTIELLARDLLALIAHLEWPEVALCGYSMGGVVSQQLLTLPFNESNPVQLPFTITHVLLVSTRCRVHVGTGLRITSQGTNAPPRTIEERKAITRRVVGSLFDPGWIQARPERFEQLVDNATNALSDRPHAVIAKQGAALQKFKFDHLLSKIPDDVQILVVHGKLDQVIPYHCGEEIVKNISRARFVEVGPEPGQVPSLDFGHYWYEYFDISNWYDVMHKFVSVIPELHAVI